MKGEIKVDDETIPLIDGEPLQEEDQTGDDSQQSAPTDFPEEAFTGLFKSYRDLVEPCTEAPSSYHWVTCLTMTGLLLGRNVFIRSPFPLYPNFYSLLVGSTGLNRKSTAMTFGVREILNKVQNNIVYVPGALFPAREFMRSFQSGQVVGFFCTATRCVLY